MGQMASESQSEMQRVWGIGPSCYALVPDEATAWATATTVMAA